MSEKQKVKRKAKKNNSIKDFFYEIGESIIGEIIFYLLMLIPRIIGKMLKVIFS